MTISELIARLETYKAKYGDVQLMSIKGDGRSSWVSPYNPTLKKTKRWPMKGEAYLIQESSY